jgi:hypothetical protein
MFLPCSSCFNRMCGEITVFAASNVTFDVSKLQGRTTFCPAMIKPKIWCHPSNMSFTVWVAICRANAAKCTAELCLAATTCSARVRLAGFSCDGKHNAIPRATSAVLLVPGEKEHDVIAALTAVSDGWKAAHSVKEPGISVSIKRGIEHQQVCSFLSCLAIQADKLHDSTRFQMCQLQSRALL